MRLPHVLFLNTRDTVAADVSVHISLAQALDRQRMRVSVATNACEAAGPSARAEFAAIPALDLFTLDLGRPLPRGGWLGRLITMSLNSRSVAGLLQLAWWCRRQRVDVIHVTERPRDALLGLLLARLAGARCLVHAHTNYYRHDATRLSNWVLRYADAVVGVSEFTAGTFVGAAGLPASRVFAVHNAVDDSTFRPDDSASERLASRIRLGLPRCVPLIGYVARLSRWKDQAMLLDALVIVRQVIPDAHLVLAGYAADVAPDGPGDYRDYLERRIEALGLREAVTFVGFLPHREMPALYATLDVLAHPAVEEPFGLAIVEALATACPVVAVGAGGIPEIIRAEVDGLLVPPREAPAMAAALVRVLGDQTLATRLAISGRERVCATFTPRHQAAAMSAVYRQIIPPGQAASDEAAERRLVDGAVNDVLAGGT